MQTAEKKTIYYEYIRSENRFERQFLPILCSEVIVDYGHGKMEHVKQLSHIRLEHHIIHLVDESNGHSASISVNSEGESIFPILSNLVLHLQNSTANVVIYQAACRKFVIVKSQNKHIGTIIASGLCDNLDAFITYDFADVLHPFKFADTSEEVAKEIAQRADWEEESVFRIITNRRERIIIIKDHYKKIIQIGYHNKERGGSVFPLSCQYIIGTDDKAIYFDDVNNEIKVLGKSGWRNCTAVINAIVDRYWYSKYSMSEIFSVIADEIAYYSSNGVVTHEKF